MGTFLKRNYLWILLFGSLIGLNETLVGSINMPYRSVVVSSVTLLLLSLGRYYLPKRGASLLIIIIAILFKINSAGIHECTTNFLMCGPAALLLLGIGHEIFASIFIGNKSFNYSSYLLTCAITSITMFGAFAVFQTYILGSWDTARLINYSFVKGSLTAIVSGTISVIAIYLIRRFKGVSSERLNPYFLNGIIGCVIIALWLIGSYST